MNKCLVLVLQYDDNIIENLKEFTTLLEADVKMFNGRANGCGCIIPELDAHPIQYDYQIDDLDGCSITSLLDKYNFN